MKRSDITKDCEYGDVDGELLTLTKCKCGEEFLRWEFSISIYDDACSVCPKCHRKLMFSNHITIYEVEDETK